MLIENLTGTEYDEKTWNLILQLEESGQYSDSIYADSVGIPTIGAGFNLQQWLDVVLEEFGFNLSDPNQAAIRDNLATIFGGAGPWQAAADAEMASWASYVGGGARNTFEFASDSEAKDVFEIIRQTFESQVDTYLVNDANQVLGDWENSYEKMALLDLAYNGILSSSSSLANAIDSDDRAEAWYEITFNSNYGTSRATSGAGIFKRRIVEGETFGLYDEENDPAWTAPTEEESLQVFRMLNKHQVTIDGELNQFPTSMGLAQTEWAALNAATMADTGSDFKSTNVDGVDSSDWLSGEFEAAADVLTEKYLDFVDRFQDAVSFYEPWGLGFENLVDYEVETIFVAAESQGANGYGHGPEVAARTVDSSQSGDTNDLIFSGIDANSSQYSYTLSAGDGDDVIVLGEGADTVDGGAGFDGVSLEMATTGQTLDFDNNQHSGSVVDGDSFSNAEYFIGSAHGDIITAGDDDLIFFGGDGSDTITGGIGDDILFAGGGATNTVDGGEGYDEIWGGSGADDLDGGDDYDLLNYQNSGAGITFNFSNGVGTGAGGDAEGDTVTNFEFIIASTYGDTITGWSDPNPTSGNVFWVDGLTGNDTVGWIGDGVVGLDGGADSDSLTVSSVANNAYAFFVGGDGTDELHLAENTFAEFSGGAGADKVYATNSQGSGVEMPAWVALGTAMPEASQFAGYYYLVDNSDKTEDRFYFDSWEMSFDLSESDFEDGGIGEYLFYTGGSNGSGTINYRGSLESNVFVGDDFGDLDITILLSETYDTQTATDLQDLYMSVYDRNADEHIVSFEILGFEQGDYGISFDPPSPMMMSSSGSSLIQTDLVKVSDWTQKSTEEHFEVATIEESEKFDFSVISQMINSPENDQFGELDKWGEHPAENFMMSAELYGEPDIGANLLTPLDDLMQMSSWQDTALLSA